ncbi:MAG TPA: hypothetical protein DCS42_00535 [Nitrospiraceae bacterium]|nr:hypothetical protein [Nitrospiraceae bacterium]
MLKRSMLVPLVLVILSCAHAFAGSPIVARVNGAGITAWELDTAVDRMIPRSAFHGKVSEEKRSEFKETALQNLIDQELQYQDAIKRGLKPDKKQVKERMKQVRDRFPSKKEYRQALEQAGISEDELRAKMEKELLAQTAIEKAVTGPSQVSEQELKTYFTENKKKFRQPESARLRLISTKDEKKAQEVLGKVKAGEEFSSLASLFSEDMYRIKGGDIGYIHRGRIFPELEKAAFTLKPGETSGLIKSEGTWFIVKVEDRKPEHELTFDEAKEKLKKDLETKRAGEIKETWMTGLRANAKIEILSKEAGDGVKAQ